MRSRRSIATVSSAPSTPPEEARGLEAARWRTVAPLLVCACAAAAQAADAFAPAGRVLRAGPADYLAALRTLRAGDTLWLEPGRYGVLDDGRDTAQPPGLPLFGLHGTAEAPIVISGPESGPWPVFLGRATHNTLRLADASHIVVRHLEIDNRGLGVQGVASQGPTHDITLENLYIRGVGDHQATVAIAANGATSWNWVVRCNRIEGAGTGMYFGNSDGRHPFVAGLVERNVVLDTIGYNVEVKHQRPWDAVLPGMPTGRTRTVIRHNVFAKRSAFVSDAGARPNLLVGSPPAAGPGSENGFEIYGNFFYENPTEALFQGEGNIAFHDNLLVNTGGTAIRVQRHNGDVRRVDIYANTIVARDEGIVVTGGQPGSVQRVAGNAVFAATPISVAGADAQAAANVVASAASAASYLKRPTAPLGELDLRPLPGRLVGDAPDVQAWTGHVDWERDFDGAPKNWAVRGAYSGDGATRRWLPALEAMPPASGGAQAACRRWLR
jgi:hypothetical protein